MAFFEKKERYNMDKIVHPISEEIQLIIDSLKRNDYGWKFLGYEYRHGNDMWEYGEVLVSVDEAVKVFVDNEMLSINPSEEKELKAAIMTISKERDKDRDSKLRDKIRRHFE